MPATRPSQGFVWWTLWGAGAGLALFLAARLHGYELFWLFPLFWTLLFTGAELWRQKPQGVAASLLGMLFLIDVFALDSTVNPACLAGELIRRTDGAFVFRCDLYDDTQFFAPLALAGTIAVGLLVAVWIRVRTPRVDDRPTLGGEEISERPIQADTPRALRARLIMLSFLMLFLELALIRWTGSNVLYLSYFSNFVLLGSFLGIGVGFLRARATRDLFGWTPIALALLIAFVRLFPVEIDRTGRELLYFGSFQPSGLPPWVMLPAIFIAVALVMTFVGEGVARVFIRFAPLEAYRLDIIGSIGGIVIFSVLSFAGAPPITWGVVVGACFLVLLGRRLSPFHAMAIAGLLTFLLVESSTLGVVWSPYYKIRIARLSADAPVYNMFVNGIPHQMITPIEERRREEPIYFLPYERIGPRPLDDVLIVGAGNGTDVAIALDEGAGHVDAVEIDPRIQELGSLLHPERPYDDPRVDVHIDDARAFLERTDRRYDLILFALPDSLTLVAGQSSLRLESYLFTAEAMEEARTHLKFGGSFGMYNYYRADWLVERLAGTLHQTYGNSPCVESVGKSGRLALLMASEDPAAIDCASPWSPIGEVPGPATDDRPFVYLKDRTIPGFYLVTIGLILVASLLWTRLAGSGIRGMGPYIDLFFMGGAFLLLETKNVVQFALLFGTTWFVNALVFTGILLAVLGAVELARRVTIRSPINLYYVLFATLLTAWLVPAQAVLTLPVMPRFIVAVVLAFAPIFVANLVFAHRFKNVGSSAPAFAANLLGAMVGGVLEYGSLVAGYRNLLILAALLYGLAFIAGRHKLAPAAP